MEQLECFVQELDSSNVPRAVCFPAAPATSGMPLAENCSSLHREKIGLPPYPDNLCVARPVGKAEIDRTPAAKASMKKEWDRLRSKMVWDEQHPREWDEVRSEAKRGGVHRTYGLSFRHLCRRMQNSNHRFESSKVVLFFKAIKSMIRITTTQFSRIWEVLLRRCRRLRRSISSAACLITWLRLLTQNKPTYRLT